MKTKTERIKISFHGEVHYARDSILRFIVRQRPDRFELCADGDSDCDAIVLDIPKISLFSNQPAEWDRLVREIGSTDRKPVVILDYSHEPWNLLHTFKARVTKTLQDTNPKIRRVVFLTQNRLRFRDGEVHRSHEGGGEIEYLYFHGILARIAAELRGLIERRVQRACLKTVFLNRIKAWRSSNPRFVCLMRKLRPHRIVVMGHLIRTGALKHGNVSFLSILERGQIEEGWTLDSTIADAHRAFPRFSDEIDALASFPEAKHEFRNFKDDMGYYLSIGIGGNASRDTQVELVAETEMGDGSQRRYTEKSLKAPLVWNAFLVCGNLSTLPLLEEVGISETGFGKDYDSVRNPQERLKAVLDRFDDFLSGSLRLDEGYLWRNRDIHARFLAKAEENIAKSMDVLSRILLDEL